MLETALQQMEAWADIGLDLPVSVNIRRTSCNSPILQTSSRPGMDTHPKVPRGHLELEVLETTALDELDSVAK